MIFGTKENGGAVLDEVRERLEARYEELHPYLVEGRQIEKALAGLRGQTGSVRRGRGRPKGSGLRPQQFLDCVRQHPEGITVGNVGRELGCQPNYFYRFVWQLEEAGLIRAEDSLWFATEDRRTWEEVCSA